MDPGHDFTEPLESAKSLSIHNGVYNPVSDTATWAGNGLLPQGQSVANSEAEGFNLTFPIIFS